MPSFSNLQVDDGETKDVSKSPDKIPPEHELEESEDQTTVMKEEQTREPEAEQPETEQQEPIPETQPQREENTSTTTQVQLTPTEVTVID